MINDEWLMRFNVAGIFPEEKDLRLTNKILIKKSIERATILDTDYPVQVAYVVLTDDEFKISNDYDIKKFGRSDFADESESGVAKKLLISALSYYTLKTGYATIIMQEHSPCNITQMKKRGEKLPYWLMGRTARINQEKMHQLQNTTNTIKEDYENYELAIGHIGDFIGLAVRQYWMAKNTHMEHLEFLQNVIALEILLRKKWNESIRKTIVRAMILICRDDDEQALLYRLLWDVFETRNKIVHEGEDIIQYDLVNILSCNIPKIIEALICLSKKYFPSNDSNKVKVCNILDEAYKNEKTKSDIQELLQKYSVDF